MTYTRSAHLALAMLLVAGCDDAATPTGADLAAPADLAIAPDASLENAACEQALFAGWRANLPSVGMASKGAAASYDAVIGKLMRDFGVPGGAVAVMKDGRLVFAKGYGFADRDDPQLTHPDDLFRVASVSKQVTAAAILKLIEMGKLALDEKPFDILADLQPLPGKSRAPKLAAITIQNLLQHSGGWNRDSTYDPMFRAPTIAAALGTMGPPDGNGIIRYMLDKAPTYDAGTTYCYSNFGYCVLGRIIERRGGLPYDQFVKQHVLGPLGAKRMALGRSFEDERADGEVRYYDYPGAPMAQSVFPDRPGQVPWPYGGYSQEEMDANGGWIASPIDLLRFQRSLDGRQPPADILAANSIAKMIENPLIPVYCTANGKTAAFADVNAYWYGFGWQVNKYKNWWHTGSLPGTMTEVVRADNGFGWAAFFNTRPQDSGGFINRLDQDLWTALNGAKNDWPTQDWFDQYDAFSPWLAEGDFAKAADQARMTGLHASRLEGRSAGGRKEFRAQWATVPPGTSFEAAIDLDCLSFEAARARNDGAGASLTNLQSFADGAGRRRFQAIWMK